MANKENELMFIFSSVRLSQKWSIIQSQPIDSSGGHFWFRVEIVATIKTSERHSAIGFQRSTPVFNRTLLVHFMKFGEEFWSSRDWDIDLPP